MKPLRTGVSHCILRNGYAGGTGTIECELCGMANPENSAACGKCGQVLPAQSSEPVSPTPTQNSKWTKVCPRCGVVNGWTFTYCAECGQSLRDGDKESAVAYDDKTRWMMQEDYRLRSRRTLARLSYLLVGALVLIVLSLILAPISSSTLNISLNGGNLVQTEHFQIQINGATVIQGDIQPGTIVIAIVPYHFPWAFTGQHQITIEGIAHGANNSNQSDARSLTVNDGGTYSVMLNL